LKRREFLATALASAGVARARQMEKNGWRITVDAAGNPAALQKGGLDLIHVAGANNQTRISGPATVEQEVRLFSYPDGGIIVRQQLLIRRGGTGGAVTVRVPRLIRLPGDDVRGLYPLKNGIAHRSSAGERAAFLFAGEHPGIEGHSLAVPMIGEWSPRSQWRVTYCTDPGFTTGFSDDFAWTYPANPGLPENEIRTIYTCIHRGEDLDAAMQAFYATALADVTPGPDWLHDIAMVDYDFLSDRGKGWFRDIDALEKMAGPLDRPKVLLTLHGWYDYCGHYTYDARTGKLAPVWTAMPNARNPEFLSRFDRPMGTNPFQWSRENVFALEPVPMSIENMHERIRYAKRRGFRVALYFADGLNACDGAPGFDPARVLRWGGWTGPETKGKSYTFNPLHPGVPAFFKGYLQALLNEYGREIDALVWDETFYVQGSDVGTPHYSGYAGRAMMQLVKDLTAMTAAFRGDLAFLVSDCLNETRQIQAPYCLMAHGTYQDTACNPAGWPYQILPNYRNVLWSCNWAPLGAIGRTRYGVEVFDIPVAISNGYAEDKGVSEMSPDEEAIIEGLFMQRKGRRMKIGWIEDDGTRRTYLGRTIRG